MWPGCQSKRQSQFLVQVCCCLWPLLSELFSGHSEFPLSNETNISNFRETPLASRFCFPDVGHVILRNTVLKRTVSFKFRPIYVHMYTWFLKRQRGKFSQSNGKQTLQADEVYKTWEVVVGEKLHRRSTIKVIHYLLYSKHTRWCSQLAEQNSFSP